VRITVTGSSGHLGQALVTILSAAGHDLTGVDRVDSPHTDLVGPLENREFVDRCLDGAEVVVHTATLHKPHIGTHTRRDFVETNVLGTFNLLEASSAHRVGCFVFLSTTSTYGRALDPPPGSPATWIDEDVTPLPKNIYGATKVAAEHLCELTAFERDLPTIVLRTSRFFPEPDDRMEIRDFFDDLNAKVNELLYRRVDIEDVVGAVARSIERGPSIGFGRYLISATTPFTPGDLASLSVDSPGVVRRIYPDFPEIYDELGWTMFPSIERVYVNRRARDELGWVPRYDFRSALDCLKDRRDPRSELALSIGIKGYHPTPDLNSHPEPRPSGR
jgi:UDP-glucose 4-epimerase